MADYYEQFSDQLDVELTEYARKYGRLIRVTAVEHDDVLAMFGLMTAREVGEV